MKRLLLSIWVTAALFGVGSCERHSFERTRVLHEPHGASHAEAEHHEEEPPAAGDDHAGAHPQQTGAGRYGESAPVAE